MQIVREGRFAEGGNDFSPVVIPKIQGAKALNVAEPKGNCGISL